MQFEPVIGLEVHAQLKTNTKIFCACSTAFGAPENSHTCPICLALPGTLPVLNRKVVEYAMRAGIATHCTINPVSVFDRKSYFYPDLPKGYQISQLDSPIAEHGYLDLDIDGETHRVGITRIHMEEDAGKLIHDTRLPVSRVDLNRGGMPLIEIVSEPEIFSVAQAIRYLRQLRAIVKYIGVCDGNMEEGSFRCDANISLRPVGQKEFGTRVEIKNLNSFRHVERALNYEIGRHTEALKEGQPLVQETRLWDPDKQKTFSMRGKEEAHDYRYSPDPNLASVEISEEWILSVKESLPELPIEKQNRYIKELGLSKEEATILTADVGLASFFEEICTTLNEPKLVANWLIGPFLGFMNAEGLEIENFSVSAQKMAQLLELVSKEVLNLKTAKVVFEEMVSSQKDAETIVAEKNLRQVSDSSALEEIIRCVLEENPNEVISFKDGKDKLMGFFVGQVMKLSQGKANPKMVNELLKQKLSE